MRIAYLLPSPELGGGNKVIFQHAELLARRGHEVTLLGEGPSPRWIELALPYVDHRQGCDQVPRQDLVITTFWTTIVRARELDLGPIAHFCQGYEGGHIHYHAQLEAIEAAYALRHPNLTVTPYLSELLEERFDNPGRVASPPLDRRFRPRRLRLQPSSEPWVAVPGVFGAQVKGVRTALAAIETLRKRGIPCRVLRLSTIDPCDAEHQHHRPERFLAGVRPEVIARELPEVDLLMMPSEPEEGFGLPLLEAMASGVPAVASRIPSTVYMTEGSVPLVPVGDAEALANAAEPLLRDPAAWRRARRRGLRAVQRFAPENIADMLEEAVRWAARVASTTPEPAERG